MNCDLHHHNRETTTSTTTTGRGGSGSQQGGQVCPQRLGPAVSSGAAFLGVEKGRRLLQYTSHREQNDTIPPCFSGQWREEWRTALFWLCQYLSALASSCLLPFGSEWGTEEESAGAGRGDVGGGGGER